MAWSSDYSVESAHHNMKLLSENRHSEPGVLAPVSSPSIPGHGVLGKRYSHQMATSGHDELDTDEFVEDVSASTPTGKKKRLSPEQVKFLETSFGNDIKLEPERKAQIAKELGLQPRQVAIWFQNRRVRWKNKQTEQEYEALKEKYELLLKENYKNIEDKEVMMKEREELVLENKELLAKVAHLTALLQRSSDPIKLMPLPGFDSDHDSGSKELTSATKSSDVSDIQDSGHSAPPATNDVIVNLVNPPTTEELSSCVTCTTFMGIQEREHPHHFYSDAEETVINPLLLQHLMNAEDIFSFCWYDQSSPMLYGADNGCFIAP